MADRSLTALIHMEMSADSDDQLIEEEVAPGEVYIYRAGNGEIAQVHVLGVYQATVLSTEEVLAVQDRAQRTRDLLM